MRGSQGGYWLAATAAALIATPVFAQEASPKAEWPKTMYACRHYGPLEGFGGTLEFDMLFTAEGTTFSQRARWSANFRPDGSPQRRARPSGADQLVKVQGKPAEGWIIVEWPNDNPWRKADPGEDPAEHATVRISNFGLFGEKMREKKERWRQTVIVRGSEVLVRQQGDDRYLILSFVEPALVTGLGSSAGPGLGMPVANLLAWGHGVDALTVYDVFVEPRKFVRNSFPDGPAGAMRIVGEYRIDTNAFADAMGKMREAHRGWRSSLTDFKKTCQQTKVDDPSKEVIVTGK